MNHFIWAHMGAVLCNPALFTGRTCATLLFLWFVMFSQRLHYPSFVETLRTGAFIFIFMVPQSGPIREGEMQQRTQGYSGTVRLSILRQPGFMSRKCLADTLFLWNHTVRVDPNKAGVGRNHWGLPPVSAGGSAHSCKYCCSGVHVHLYGFVTMLLSTSTKDNTLPCQFTFKIHVFPLSRVLVAPTTSFRIDFQIWIW